MLLTPPPKIRWAIHGTFGTPAKATRRVDNRPCEHPGRVSGANRTDGPVSCQKGWAVFSVLCKVNANPFFAEPKPT